MKPDLYFIQTVPTPHNNNLLKLIKNDFSLHASYAEYYSIGYNWSDDLYSAVVPAEYYKSRNIDWSFIKRMLNAKGHIFLVGWSNATTRILFILLCLFRKRFSMWFDLPDETATRSRLGFWVRESFYLLLKYSNVKIFCVGNITVRYFFQRGFKADKLLNFPILIKPDSRNPLKHNDNLVRIFTGSRLTYEKGFDIFLEAIGMLPENIRNRINVEIAGDGPEKENLEAIINQHGLKKIVRMTGWLNPEDFSLHLIEADIIIHPSRKDAYGLSIYGLVNGKTVISSNMAGAGLEHIVDGENGFLYKFDSPEELASKLQYCILNPEILKITGEAAHSITDIWNEQIALQTFKAEIY